jgi:hypothetical protein
MSSVREHAEHARLHGAEAAYANACADGLSPRQFGWLLVHLRRLDPDWRPAIGERHRLTRAMLEAGVPDQEIREALRISQPTLWRFKRERADTTPEGARPREVGPQPRSTTGANHSKPANRPHRSDPASSTSDGLLTPPRLARPDGMPTHLCGLCPRKHLEYATRRAAEINEPGPGTTRREFERKMREGMA